MAPKDGSRGPGAVAPGTEKPRKRLWLWVCSTNWRYAMFSLEMFEVCQGLIARNFDLEVRIDALVPESTIQVYRTWLTEAVYSPSCDLVLDGGRWEDEFPF